MQPSSAVRQSALALCAHHNLTGADLQRLRQHLGLHSSGAPLASTNTLPRAITILAAALGGLGVLMWLAPICT